MKHCLTPTCPNPALPSSMGGARCGLCEGRRNRDRNRKPERAAYRDPRYRAMAPRGGPCHLCGELGADTRDHIKPLAEGGTNDPSNIAFAHRACNSARR